MMPSVAGAVCSFVRFAPSSPFIYPSPLSDLMGPSSLRLLPSLYYPFNTGLLTPLSRFHLSICFPKEIKTPYPREARVLDTAALFVISHAWEFV
jgi:hypothetical protein